MSLFGRFILLVMAALAPVAAGIIYNEYALRQAHIIEASETAARLVAIAAREQERITEGARQLLSTLVQLPDLRQRNGPTCSTVLASLQQRNPAYLQLYAADAAGRVFCASSSEAIGGKLAPERVTAIAGAHEFSIAGYEIEPVTGRPAMEFSLPYYQQDGALQGVIAATMSLDWLNDHFAAQPLPKGAFLNIADRDGVLLVRSPDRDLVGQRLPPEHLAFVHEPRARSTEVRGLDGSERIYAYDPVGTTPGAKLFVSVGIDKQAALADVNAATRRDIVFIVLGVALVTVGVWYGGRRFISLPVDALLAAVERWREGDRGARTGLIGGAREIRRLATAFDSMAQAVEDREARLLRAKNAAEASEATARRTRAQLVDAIESIPEAFAFFDADDRLAVFNSRWRELYPAIADLFVTGTPYEALVRANAERSGRMDEAWIQEQLSFHRNANGQRELRLPDGHWVRIDDRRTADGGWVGTRVDITELKENAATSRLLFEDNPVPMWVFDAETLQFLDVNESAIRHYGYKREWFLSRTLDKLFPADQVAWLRQSLQEGRDLREVRVLARHRKADGSVIDVDVVRNLVSYRGRKARLVAALDVSARVAAERALRQSAARLERSQQHLARAQRVAAIGSWEMDHRSQRLTWSDEMYRIHSVSREAFDGSLGDAIRTIHPEDQSRMRRWIEQALTGAPPGALQARILRPSGEIRWGYLEGEAMFDEDGKTVGLIGIVRDITEEKNAEVELRRVEDARRELEARLQRRSKLEALGTLAGGIAHEFNNLLLALSGFIDMTLALQAADSPSAQNLRDALSAVDEAKEIVRQVLAFGRRGGSRREAVPIGLAIMHALRLLKVSLPRRIELRERIDSDCDVLADSTQLHQVILNLGANARDAIGGRPGLIEVGLIELDVAGMRVAILGLAPGRYAQITFRDSGCGMPLDVKSRIFEPFFSTKPVGKGGGLGLSVVHGIVTQHGGAIEVESSPGEGTCFTILLPVLPAAASAEEDATGLHGSAE